jgi:hypothetical protein
VSTKVDAKTRGDHRPGGGEEEGRQHQGQDHHHGGADRGARAQLEALGFKIKNTKGKNVIITVPTGGQKAAVDALARHRRPARQVGAVTTTFYTKGSKSAVAPAHRNYAARAASSAATRAADRPCSSSPNGAARRPGHGHLGQHPGLFSNGEYVIKAATPSQVRR